MSERVGLPCPKCDSSDAYGRDESNPEFGHCFSCGANPKWEDDDGVDDLDMDSGVVIPSLAGSKGSVTLIRGADIEYKPLAKRKLSQAVCKKYGYGVTRYHFETVHIHPVKDMSGQTVAQKLRFADKKMQHIGNAKGDTMLFGQWLCREGGKMIVITEGEIDAMSVCQAMGMSWPAVSITQGAAGAKRELEKHLSFLETYDKVVLMFDNDEAGSKATQQCLELFSPGKVALADLGGFKDANEALQAGEAKLVRDAVWGAKEWRPDGIVRLVDIKDRIKSRPEMGHPYPWPKLNEILFGWRGGELTTWTAGTGVGKTALVSELLFLNIANGIETGIVFLEEGIEVAGKRIIGLQMGQRIHLPGCEYTDEEWEAAWDATLGHDKVSAYDHFGENDAETLINRIRYMIKVERAQCIILDHISMVVSGQEVNVDERKMLDYITTRLRKLVQETGASIHVVCHLRRTNGGAHEEGAHVSINHLRGTQAIAQLSNTIIAAERDQQDDCERLRNTTQLRVLKNRYAGITGPADTLFYSPETGRLNLEEKPDVEDLF